MAQPEHLQQYLRGLGINTQPSDKTNSSYHSESMPVRNGDDEQQTKHPADRIGNLESGQDVRYARSSQPMEIPGTGESGAFGEGSDESEPARGSYMDHYMRNRKTSISFDTEVHTDSGCRQSVGQPLPKPDKSKLRGRSMMQALTEERQKSSRAHSESDRAQYDPNTGRHLPQYSTSPPREAPRIGEARFPFLQITVDEMARESQPSHSENMSSTMSPDSVAVLSPKDEPDEYPTSPIPINPFARHISSSFESARSYQRKASQRWRDGEAAQDFFSRAGGTRGSLRQSNPRSSRRDTNSSTKSPKSAASSFLRGFSYSSHSGEEIGAPAAVDAEGQTIGEDYVLGKQIGYGGFSTVKEVTHMSSETGEQRKLAVKIVRRVIEGKSEIENEAAQTEFEHEVELWRFLCHRHILPLEAVYKLDEATFCFTPLNVGGTLFDLVRANRKGLPDDITKFYIYQVASGLRYLHLDARVVHRDIKLENCLIDTSNGQPGIIRICDFGMAEWLTSDNSSNSSPQLQPHDRPGNTHTASFDRSTHKVLGPADSSTAAFAGGSLEYAAPEILRIANSTPDDVTLSANRSIISPAVDIWALGVCAFSLVMGSRPFSDNFVPRVVMAILAGDWDRDSLRRRNPDAADFVESCLEMNDQERWSISRVVEDTWFDETRLVDDVNGNDTNTGRWRL